MGPKLVLTMHEREWRDPVSGLWAQWMESDQNRLLTHNLGNGGTLAAGTGFLS
jgi:hypothetical protein